MDRDIESAAVVRNVLDFLHDAMFELSDDLESIQTNILASRFMEKYDMASLLRHRDNILKEHAHRADFSHRAVFILASAADRLEICAIVIRRNARLPTPGQPEARRHIMETGEINRLLDSQHCLDIVSWPYCFVELIPRPYGESLHRAFRKAGVFNSDWSKVAGHFEALMQEHKGGFLWALHGGQMTDQSRGRDYQTVEHVGSLLL